MKFFLWTLRLALPLCLLLSLAGCGSGDDNDSPFTPPGDDSPLMPPDESVGENRPPIADAGQDRRVLLDQPATLDASKSTDPDGDTLTYLWEITSRPEDSLATIADAEAEQATFSPDVEGVYTLRLTVGDGEAYAIAPLTLNAVPSGTNLPPVADPGQDRTVPVNSVVDLSASGSTDPNDDPLSYTWEILSQPSGSSATLSDATDAETSFTADVAGAYEVQLVVSDGLIESAPERVVIQAVSSGENIPPVADAGRDRTVTLNTLVILDGSGSSDPDGTPLTFDWTILERPPESNVTITQPNSSSPSFFADRGGVYRLELTVHDSEGAMDSDQVTVTAGDSIGEGPVADAGPDQQVPVGTLVTLDGSGSTGSNGDLLNYQWLMLERPANSTATLQAPTSAVTSFAPDREGIYLVQLTVSDPLGNLSTDLVQVLAGISTSGQQIYDDRCAVCHSLGLYDPDSTVGASDLWHLGDRVPLVFDPDHAQITLTEEEMIAVQQFLDAL